MTPFSGPDPAQLAVADEVAPEGAHVGVIDSSVRPTTSGASASTAATHDLVAAADRERQAVALEPVRASVRRTTYAAE